MANHLFSTITVRYVVKDQKNPQVFMTREITEVHDLNQCIHQTAKSARLLDMTIDAFTVEVEYAQI